jgi:(5-formylfuran-3-yl)methyl phosphate synthase
MSWFLASVRSSAEARVALGEGVDVLDLKEPSEGALGAVSAAVAAQVVKLVAGRVPVSATVGDLGGRDPRLPLRAASLLAAGVDVLKVGLFDQHALSAIESLATTHGDVPIVPVAFAEMLWRSLPLADFAAAGVELLMLDTREKRRGSLLQQLDISQLQGLADAAQAHGMRLGLAGSLALTDLPRVLALEPALVGLRGALCAGSREATLSAALVAAARAAIPREARPASENSRRRAHDILA